MRVTLFAHGLRGDVWPLVALGWNLARRDHEVTIAVTDEFRTLAERAGLRTARLPFDMMAWLETPEGQRLLHSSGFRLLYGIQRQYRRYAEEFDAAYIAAAGEAEALVATALTWDRSLALSDHLRAPMAVVFTHPAAPSAEYEPLALSGGRQLSPMLRRISHELAGLVWWRGVAASTQRFRGKLGLPPNRRATHRRVFESEALKLNTCSPSLFPRPSDWTDSNMVTAAWQMPEPLRDDLGEGLPAELEAWLNAGEPPLFLGFGSMPVLEPEPLLADITSVAESMGQRVIVSRNCVPPGAEELPDHLWAVDAVDHDRLFPRCAAVVHHGGIGSLHSSLRAGRPTMVCSAFVDQPWWGERVRRLGVGVHVPFRELDRERLEAGLRTLLDPAVMARADALGQGIRAEGDGLPEATTHLEDWLLTARARAAFSTQSADGRRRAQSAQERARDRHIRRRRVPAVDPTKPRRVRKVLIEPLARSEAGRWWLINVSPRLDKLVFRMTGGRFTTIPAHLLTLTHTGARTGQIRENLLTYFTDGDDLIVMASNYGRERHPNWYYNVKANPDVEVRAAGLRGRYRAHVTTDEDRERLWGLAKALTKTYADYEERAAGRRIQVIRLTPADD
ncbi:MAG TPA: nitroreductase/quinone reductase family protein [Solirubrobacterales bacterium]|nr:nitroreductase/quinone reductase family protein [Solirubrobacterales bacterium]